MQNFIRLFQIGQKGVQYVPQSGSRISHPVGNMQPTFFGFDGSRALPVFDFFDGVILPFIDDDLFVNLSLFNILSHSPANTAACTGLDKVILILWPPD
jgi:hypothetical protein